MDVSCDISWFAERDIDVWLAEELRVNPSFARWFLDKVGLPSSVSVPAYWTRISVLDETGRETDVEALFRASNGSTAAVLVENKIKASFQPNQMEDYVDRGQRGEKDGRWSVFSVAVFAPSYRFPLGIQLPPEVRLLKFEEAAQQVISNNDGTRTMYRAKLLERAAHPNVVAIETENPFIIEWWKAVDAMVQREFGDFFMIDRQRFPKTTYVNPKCPHMASYLRVDLKGSQGEVDLAFKKFPKSVLNSLVSSIMPEGVELIENKGSSALRIGNLHRFQVSDGLEIIEEHVLAAYQAAYKLLSFWRVHRALFDEAAGKLSKGDAAMAPQ
jgi:hypothetical protein